MTPLTAGGIPPFGKDMNGILFMVSSYCAYLQAGQQTRFSSSFATAAGGYAVGAVLQSAADPRVYFVNTVDGNTNDPDSVITGWVPYAPSASSAVTAQTATIASGSHDDFALNAGVGFLDLTGNVDGTSALTGLANGVNGQTVIVTNVAAPAVTLKALTGSSAGNQLRLPADITLLQYSNLTFRKSSTLGVWVPQ
jgi:hypothetical protein